MADGADANGRGMTNRELRLRMKIDELRDRIDELEEVRGHCVY